MKKLVKVVSAIIKNDQNEVLCALRSPEMSIPNMWEFSGGKVEANEDIYSALKRDIDKELDCKIETAKEGFNDNTPQFPYIE